MTAIPLPAFVADQPAAHVDASLRQALEACDRAQECAVLWFAEIQRRALYRALGHASLQLYATVGLGFPDNRYWQFKRLADDLDRLPVLREAVATGAVGWTKAQQVARVATVETQAAWVALASSQSRRVLSQEVKRARKQQPAGQLAMMAPAQPTAPAADPPTTITLRADGVQLARFEALVEKAHKLKRVSAGTDRMDLMLAALEALIETRRRANESSGPAVQIVVQQCPDCAAATVVTNRGERKLAPAQVEALACDARVQREGKPNRATIKPSVRAAVLARDRHRCAAPGCRSTHFLEVHHVKPRQQGGSNRAENLITLCSRCHGFVHEHGGALAPAQVVGLNAQVMGSNTQAAGSNATG